MGIHSLGGGGKIKYTNWVSECCESVSLGELDMGTVPYGGPSGFCSTCKDNCIFVELDESSYDEGDPFDTREEKYGQR